MATDRPVILALDIGTSEAKGGLIGAEGRLLASARRRYPVAFDPASGRSEQDPRSWWSALVAIALVPMLEWLERQGVPSKLAAVMCVVIFLSIMAFAIGSIVVPAMDWVVQVPERIGRVQSALAPVLDLYKSLDKYIDRIFSQIVVSSSSARASVEAPSSSVRSIPAT